MSAIGALDIGGSKILAGLLTPDGRVRATRRKLLEDRGPAAVAETAAALLGELADERRVRLAGVGCSIPGPLNRHTGVVLLSPNLGWKHVRFASMLRGRLGVPVAIDDDARCAAIGEWWRGAGRQARCLLYIVVGTGVGGGLILEGRVVYGASDSAGEIGHTIVRPGGPRCSCGKRGCLEALASGTAIARAFRLHGGGARTTGMLRDVTAAQVVSAALRGHRRAAGIVREAGAALGVAVANAVTLLNLDRVILGGSVGRGAGRIWLPCIRRDVARLTLEPSARRVRVSTGALGEAAGLIGAAWMFLHRHGHRTPFASPALRSG